MIASAKITTTAHAVRTADAKLNKSLSSSCYELSNRGNPPKPPREYETRRSQPGGFLHDAQSAKNRTQAAEGHPHLEMALAHR